MARGGFCFRAILREVVLAKSADFRASDFQFFDSHVGKSYLSTKLKDPHALRICFKSRRYGKHLLSDVKSTLFFRLRFMQRQRLRLINLW